ncbi:hypothetical protein ACIBI7_15405 [Nonomuraea fuscirosea]|uniref:hypothetical protein n=1 Tax=Nonomuraea fuscirosea TaxID=1291556 RepID=UPI0037B8E07A
MDLLDDLHMAELGPIIWLQGLPGAVRPVLALVSVFGTDTFFLLCLPVLYWCVSPALGLRLGCAPPAGLSARSWRWPSGTPDANCCRTVR